MTNLIKSLSWQSFSKIQLTTFMIVEVSPGTAREDGPGPSLYILAFIKPTPDTLRTSCLLRNRGPFLSSPPGLGHHRIIY